MRYRINKIKSILVPELNYEGFYNELSVSVKVYLIKKANDFLSNWLFNKLGYQT